MEQRRTMHTLSKALLATSITLFFGSAIYLLFGLYPRVGKINPNDVRIYQISNQFLWAIVFALAMERAFLFEMARGRKIAIMLVFAFFSASGITTAITRMTEYARSLAG